MLRKRDLGSALAIMLLGLALTWLFPVVGRLPAVIAAVIAIAYLLFACRNLFASVKPAPVVFVEYRRLPPGSSSRLEILTFSALEVVTNLVVKRPGAEVGQLIIDPPSIPSLGLGAPVERPVSVRQYPNRGAM
jgi:hypothetical protein